MHTLIPDTSKPVLSARLNRGSGPLIDSTLIPDVVGALSDGAHCGGGLNGQDAYSGRIIPVVGALTAKGPQAMGAPEVDANHYIVHGTQDPITSDIAMPLQEKNAGSVNALAIRTANTGANGHGVADEVAHTIDGAQGQAVAFAQNQRDEVRIMDKAGALAAEPGAKQQTYIAETKQVQWASGGGKVENDTMQALRSNAEHNYQFLRQDMAVRRLTPLECERLQGFPDGYTDIPGASDSGRYKALGNSMAVPVMAWIGRRIQEVHDENM